MNTPLKHFSVRRATVPALLLVAVASVVTLSARAWYQELTAPITCMLRFPDPKPQNGYIEFQVLSQEAIEPMFHGQIMVFLTPNEYSPPTPTVLEYRSSGGGTYADTVGKLRMAEFDDQGSLRMPSPAEFGYVNIGRAHRWFPFDNGKFHLQFSFEPLVLPGFIRITNRVPGFVVECPLQASRNPDGSLDIRFNLTRSPLVQLVAVVLCFAMVIFGITMFGLKSYESLATAVASYFFSLWSIRHIVSSEVRIFPSLLDMFILTVSVLVLTGLVWRVLRHGDP